ncbi:hypothetical protein CPC08DRAFT_684782 [Agrocybe pediades]|nr:hypothetical protein CPC08DRAFT_684782 [Agrocybe pediades]
MATFSPSPAPRRSNRLQAHGTSPAARLPRRLAPAPTVLLNDAASVTSAMDVDERSSVMTDRSLSRISGELVFAKTNEMSVLFYATLPLEVKQVLKISDFKTDPYSGEIDTVTGFALVASVETCFVWQHAQAIKGIPTCYIFSCPQDTESSNPPLHALVPQGSSREPGLILVSPAGSIRFWDSIGIGLAGGNNYVSSHLEDMEYDEDVTNLVRVNAQTYILSTSYGRLYRLTLTSVGGKYHLTIRAFARPSSNRSFTRLFQPFLPVSQSSYDIKDKNKYIHAVSLGAESSIGDRDVWVLANGTLQLWSMKAEGWEDLVHEHDLSALLLQGLKEKRLGLVEEDQDVELSDLAIFDNQNIAILISYSAFSSGSDFKRYYALAELKPIANGFTLEHLHPVPYQTTNNPGLPVHPRIQLVFSGSIISVQFGDAVALCSRESGYGDRLELEDSKDRTFGVGVTLSGDSILILTASTMMKVCLDLEKIQSFNSGTGSAGLIKSTMMQSILYASTHYNPLRFSLPPVLSDEPLMQAAQQLSDEVMRSDPEVVRQSHDMHTQIAGRKDRLSWLINFINENDVLSKISQTARQKLATDAEKLYAASRLWTYYNESLSTSSSQSVLQDAVVAHMQEVGDGHHEDPVRAFFRTRVGEIGKVSKKVVDVVKSAEKNSQSNINAQLAEASNILTTVLKSAFDYRDYNMEVYGVVLPMNQPWTSRPSIIDALLSLFEMITKAVEPTSTNVRDKGRDLLIAELPKLAAVLFQSVKERLDWLQSEPGQAGAMEVMQQRFAILRPEVLETLRTSGHATSAFLLAEKYHDYASLVSLCHKGTVYPPEENPYSEKIHEYISRFKEEFVVELFRWYIQHGELRTMFDQQAPGASYLDFFFNDHPDNSISWINDLGKSRHSPAASALLADATNAKNLEAKHLMLSIGKLSYLAAVQETNVADDSMLDAFHNGLDFVSVHEELTSELRSALHSVRSRQSIEAQLDTIISQKCEGLTGKPGFNHIFRDITRQLLQGKALEIEDMVEVLTLKDNTQSVEDFVTSLHLLATVENLPEARKQSAIRTVWRRIYLHDDWNVLKQTAGLSDQAINAQYQSTALYITCCSAPVTDENKPLILSPGEALAIPSTEEIVSRWPGMSTEQIDALTWDYESEASQLIGYDLGEEFAKVMDLAMTSSA